MTPMIRLAIVLLLSVSAIHAQTIVWTDITTNYDVPSGIRVYRGERSAPLQKLFYVDVDLNNPSVVVRPYISTVAEGKETGTAFLSRVGAIAGINGGFFSGSTSLSAVVHSGEVKAQNIASVTRTAGVYPVTRAFFGLRTTRTPEFTWIYHFSSSLADLYRFAAPTPNTQAAPAPAPTKAGGMRYDSLLAGLGGGPMLVKGGSLRYTYDEEVFFGSGVDGDATNPRTAVGVTASNHVIMLTADGRQAASYGVTLPELAQILMSLGCVEAMNLDGGGSTQMAAKTYAGYAYVNVPSETRAVPTILAAVYSDSLQGALVPLFEKIVDTGDSALCVMTGGWFASANAGWWGSTQTQLAAVGGQESRARFTPELPREARYEVYAWWVAASNRSTQTPFFIQRKGGADTVRVNQAQNGSQWVKLGTFMFSGDSTDAVTVTNAATTGSYVCADAVRFVSYDPVFTGLRMAEPDLPAAFSLEQNYPNPFNPLTTIDFSIAYTGHVVLKVYDILGREVSTLLNEKKDPGRYRVTWRASGVSSGTFFCRLQSGNATATRRMVLTR